MCGGMPSDTTLGISTVGLNLRSFGSCNAKAAEPETNASWLDVFHVSLKKDNAGKYAGDGKREVLHLCHTDIPALPTLITGLGILATLNLAHEAKSRVSASPTGPGPASYRNRDGVS